MPSIHQRLQLMREHMSVHAARATLIDALSRAESKEINPIAQELLKIPGVAAIEAILDCYDGLSDQSRDHFHRISREFGPSLLRAVLAAAGTAEDEKEDEQVRGRRRSLRRKRLAALHAIRMTTPESCIPALRSILMDEQADGATVALGAACVLAYVRQASRPGSSNRHWPHEAGRMLEEIVFAWVDAFPKHRQYDVLLAAAHLTSQRPGPALQKWLADTSHPAHLPMRGLLKRLRDDQLAPRLLEWLGHDLLAPQALDHLNRLSRTPALAAIIRGRTHWLRLPVQQRRLQQLDSRRQTAGLPSLIDVSVMDEAAQVAYAHWVGMIPLRDETQRINLLTDTLVIPSRAARLAALTQLIALGGGGGRSTGAPHRLSADPTREPSESSSEGKVAGHDLRAATARAIESFCYDADESIARTALRVLMVRQGSNPASLAQRLRQSPHASVRDLATRAGESSGWGWRDDLWANWNAHDPLSVEHRIAVRMTLARDSDSFVGELRRRLSEGDRGARLKALHLADTFDLLPLIELEMLAMSRMEDHHLSSAAMKYLARIGSSTCRQVLAAALEHPDARTRANAVENLGPDQVSESIDRLNAIALDDDANRPRANAIVAVATVDRPKAAQRLAKMLADSRPMHRISGLWAAQEAGMIECARDVAEAARGDAVQPVRARAVQTAGSLLNILRESKAQVIHASEMSGPEAVPSDGENVQVSPSFSIEQMAASYPPPIKRRGGTRTGKLPEARGSQTAQGAGQVAPAVKSAMIFLAVALSLAFASMSILLLSSRPVLAQSAPAAADAASTSEVISIGSGGVLGWMQGHATLMAVAGVGVAILISLLIARRRFVDERGFGPDCRKLARALNLSARDTRLLNRIARRHGLKNASSLLISEGAFKTICFERGHYREGSARHSRLITIRRSLFITSPKRQRGAI